MEATLLFPELSAPQSLLAFPQTLTDKYRPTRIADFAGLAEPKRILSRFALNPIDSGLIFIGPAGTGKTSMALALARELQAFVHHIPAQKCTVESIDRVSFSCHYFPPAGYRKHVVLIDEADLMSPAAQTALLSKLDGTAPVPDTLWVFTCNGTERLHERFVSRCSLQLNFSTYAIQAEAAQLLEAVWSAEAPLDAPAPNFARIIKESTGNVRNALATLQSKLLAA
jgi:replication-associated recombination protein RarA